jgi:hypothetical protein
MQGRLCISLFAKIINLYIFRLSCSFSTFLIVCGQANSWSLEELHLDVTIAEESDQPSFDDCSFGVEGLKLTGAVCRYLTQLLRLLNLFPVSGLVPVRQTL